MKHESSGIVAIVESDHSPRSRVAKHERAYFRQNGTRCDNTRYIEAITDERFTIFVRIPTHFSLKRNEAAQISVEVDGIKNLFVRYVTKESLEKQHSRSESFTFEAFASTSGGKQQLYALSFAEAEIGMPMPTIPC